MKHIHFLMISTILVILLLAGCGQKQKEQENQDMQQSNTQTGQFPTTEYKEMEPLLDASSTEEVSGGSYQQITQEEAKEIMDQDNTAMILDVRTQEEYNEGHIKNARLIPHDQITDRAEEEIPAKDQQILVYCRSGSRSRQAAQALAELGYTNVKEFGGITTWPYEIEE